MKHVYLVGPAIILWAWPQIWPRNGYVIQAWSTRVLFWGSANWGWQERLSFLIYCETMGVSSELLRQLAWEKEARQVEMRSRECDSPLGVKSLWVQGLFRSGTPALPGHDCQFSFLGFGFISLAKARLNIMFSSKSLNISEPQFFHLSNLVNGV